MLPASADGEEKRANPKHICAFGKQLHSEIDPDLKKAQHDVQDARTIEDSNFTATTRFLATIYAESLELMEEDIKTKRKDLMGIWSKLCESAHIWSDAEHKSTIIKA